MLQSADDAPRVLAEGRSLLGPGWKVVDSFDDLENEDEFEGEEEEVYVTMDLGDSIDNRTLQSDTQYQLVGLDTPLPFLRLANQIFQGESTPLIGGEIILGLIRNQENPHNPSHPPIHCTQHRLTFRPVTLRPFDQPEDEMLKAGPAEKGKAKKITEEPRSIFPQRAPNKPANERKPRARKKVLPIAAAAAGATAGVAQTGPGPAEEEEQEEDEVDVMMETEQAEAEAEAGPSQRSVELDELGKKKRGRPEKPKSLPADQFAFQMVTSGFGSPPAAGPSGPPPNSGDVSMPKKTDRPQGSMTGLKVIVSAPTDFERLDLDSLVEIAPEVQYDLGFEALLPSGVSSDKTSFTKKEVRKLKAGEPAIGPGSRGGRRVRGGLPSQTRTKKWRKKGDRVEHVGLYLAVGGVAGDGDGGTRMAGEGDETKNAEDEGNAGEGNTSK